MKSTKFSLALAVLTVCGGLAVAQPAADAGTSTSARGERARMGHRGGEAGAGREAGGMREAAMGPFGKLRMASRLTDLTPEQKTKIDAFMQENKAESESLQKEFRDAMQKARDTTDRDQRRAAMGSIREKFQASDKKVNQFLKGTLTEEQQTKLAGDAAQMRQRAGERVRDARDASTSASAGNTAAPKRARAGKAANKRDGKPGDHAGKKGDKAGKKGKKGKKGAHAGAAATPSDDHATSSSAPNPFVKQ